MFSVFGYIWCLLQVPKSFLLQILGKDRVTKFLIEEIVSITVGDFVKKVCPFSFISYYISSQCLNLENYLNLLSLSGKFEGEEPIQDNTNCRWAWISIYAWYWIQFQCYYGVVKNRCWSGELKLYIVIYFRSEMQCLYSLAHTCLVTYCISVVSWFQ